MYLFRTLLANARDKFIFDFTMMAEYSEIVHFVRATNDKKSRASETDLIMF
jgi:hypothetical protein